MTTEPAHQWTTEELEGLLDAVVALHDRDQARRFLRDLCTIQELEVMSQRWAVAKLLDQKIPYLEISRRTGASTTTVTRVAHWLHHGEGGYAEALRRARRRRPSA